MANAILFYDGKDFSYPEDLTNAGELGAARTFCKRIFTVLSSLRYLGYPEILEIGYDFNGCVLFTRGQRGLYARYEFVKGSYPFTTEMAKHFVFQIVLPQLELLAKG